MGRMADMLPEFRTHNLNDAGAEKTEEIRKAFSELLANVERIVPAPSRERSLVATKLQEACMFAVRAVSVLPENQK